MSRPIRIVYHPAPGPSSAGKVVAPEPIDLGTDLPTAYAWIAARLGIVRRVTPDEAIWSAEPLELPAEFAVESGETLEADDPLTDDTDQPAA